jgi:hypothetical protein
MGRAACSGAPRVSAPILQSVNVDEFWKGAAWLSLYHAKKGNEIHAASKSQFYDWDSAHYRTYFLIALHTGFRRFIARFRV